MNKRNHAICSLACLKPQDFNFSSGFFKKKGENIKNDKNQKFKFKKTRNFAKK